MKLEFPTVANSLSTHNSTCVGPAWYDRLLTSFKLISLNEVNLCSMGKFAFVRALFVRHTTLRLRCADIEYRVTSHRILSLMLITFDLQLQACVGRRMTWRDTTLYAIALFGANFSLMEKSTHRQKIWRAMWDSDLRRTWSNLLLLFCGIYRTSPPTLFSFLCVAAPLLFFCWAVTHRETCFSQFLWRKKKSERCWNLCEGEKQKPTKVESSFRGKMGGRVDDEARRRGEKSSLCVNTLTRVEWTRYTSTRVKFTIVEKLEDAHSRKSKANWKLLQVFFPSHCTSWLADDFSCVYICIIDELRWKSARNNMKLNRNCSSNLSLTRPRVAVNEKNSFLAYFNCRNAHNIRFVFHSFWLRRRSKEEKNGKYNNCIL